MKTPIVFFGSSQIVLPIIEFLHENYDLKLVVTTEKSPTDAVPAYCKGHNLPFISVTTKEELLNTKSQILDTKSPLAVCTYFGLIISQEIIDIFPKGIINIHPSRLPQYRGTTPGQTALILGDVKTAVSIMLLDPKMDHGPILSQEEEVILPTDTSVTLYERLFKKGLELLEAVIPVYLTGELKPVEQDHTKATFTKPLTRESGFLDSTKPISPHLVDRMIRAYYPWPGVWTTWQVNDKEKVVKLLPGKKIQVEGKKPMSYRDFMNGYEEGKKFLEKLQLT